MTTNIEKHREYMSKVFDLIDYYRLTNTKHEKNVEVISVCNGKDFDLSGEQISNAIYDLCIKYPKQIKIYKKRFYNHYQIVHEHWLPEPFPGQPDTRPLAEIIIKEPVGTLREMFNADVRKILGDSRIEITIDFEKGIYPTNVPDKVYLIKRYRKNLPTKRFLLLKLLHEGKQICSSHQILKRTNFSENELIKAVKKINQIFTKKTGLKEVLIESVATGGYKLNTDKYIF